MSTARAMVGLAAALLPRRSRERYREQWQGELRDAEEAGIRPAEIALGSLAFAATFDRPLPTFPRATPTQSARWSRLAAGLALAAAVVGITRYADFVEVGESTGSPVYDFVVFLASMLLLAFAVLAPVTAVLLATATRGAARTARVAVWLLALASLAPLANAALDSWLFLHNSSLITFVSPGNAAYPAAVALVAIAATLLRRARPPRPRARRTPGRRIASSAAGGLVVLLAGGAALALSALVWADREPLVFGWQPSIVTKSGPSGLVHESIAPTIEMYEEWLSLKLAFEQLVQNVFAVWTAAVVVLAIVVVVVGLLRSSTTGHTATAVAATLCILLIGFAAVLSFLKLAVPTAAPLAPTEALLLIGRWGLVAIVLATVGGVRYRARVAHVPAPAGPAAAV